ncbi:hypothetical protein [Verrucomicrobium sp. BvORR106]|uniref:hypothetical protein n=1 Tax=Verrucomicrobium sp. BvORR106 TaxID=1403819 RepID=UPI00057046B7|nr:hypothetical protein [Verrucomicrobium sp. BvORR106]
MTPKWKHHLLISRLVLGALSLLQLSTAFSQEPKAPLKLVVYYSTIQGADHSEKATKGSTVFRTTFFVYLKNVSDSPIFVATRSPHWPDRMDGSRIAMLSVSEKFTPVDEPIKQAPGDFAIVKLEQGDIASLGNYDLMTGEAPLDLDLYKFIYSVDPASANQLSLWQGEVMNTSIQSVKAARAAMKK